MHTVNKRAKNNTNLTLNQCSDFNGYPVITHRGPLVVEYLQQIDKTILNALTEHPRTLAVRVDLHFPLDKAYQEMLSHPTPYSDLSALDMPYQEPAYMGTDVISRFFASHKAQIEHDLENKKKAGKRGLSCTVRYVWAKERKFVSNNPHYHLLILFNRDTYNCLGNYHSEDINMAKRIVKAWASATGLPIEEVYPLVHFPERSIYHINSKLDNFQKNLRDLFYRASYLAKIDTKEYLNGTRHFGSSRR